MEKTDEKNRDIVYTKTIKAGRRIYYIDLKKNRYDDIYLSLTESKKKNLGDSENPNVMFEKHKIFLYKEDLQKFTDAFVDVIKYMNQHDDSSTQEEKDSLINICNTLTSESPEPTDNEDLISETAPIKINLEDF